MWSEDYHLLDKQWRLHNWSWDSRRTLQCDQELELHWTSRCNPQRARKMLDNKGEEFLYPYTISGVKRVISTKIMHSYTRFVAKRSLWKQLELQLKQRKIVCASSKWLFTRMTPAKNCLNGVLESRQLIVVLQILSKTSECSITSFRSPRNCYQVVKFPCYLFIFSF